MLASLRCVVQLTVMGMLLKPILENSNISIMIALSLAMMVIGTLEVSHFRVQTKVTGLFFVVFFSVSIGCTLVATLGSLYAIQSVPFYNPRQFLPVLGMLMGNSITGTALSIHTFIDQVTAHKDRIDFVLGIGGTRWEAVRFAFVKSLQMGLLPCLNSMSMQGFVSIPGMLTGQILAGMNPIQAVKYQQIINYLICASTGITTLISTLFVYRMVFDERDILDLKRLRYITLKEVLRVMVK